MEELIPIIQGLNTKSIIGAIVCIFLCIVLVSLLKKYLMKFLQKHFPTMGENAKITICKSLCLVLAITFWVFLLNLLGFTLSGLTLLLLLLIVAVATVGKMLIENGAAGATVMLQKAYKVGDYISYGDFEGIVKMISFNDTILLTDEGKKVKIPNGNINTDAVSIIGMDTPYPLSVTVPVAQSADPEQVMSKLKEAAKAVEGVLRDEDVSVGIAEIKPLTVEYECSVYCRFEDRSDVTYALNEAMLGLIRNKEI